MAGDELRDLAFGPPEGVGVGDGHAVDGDRVHPRAEVEVDRDLVAPTAAWISSRVPPIASTMGPADT